MNPDVSSKRRFPARARTGRVLAGVLGVLAVLTVASGCIDPAGPGDGGPTECVPGCGPGQLCSGGRCLCQPGLCPGCCAGDQCVASSDRACGLDGVACSDCGGLTPRCAQGACVSTCELTDPTACAPGGCCAGSRCMDGTQTATCGNGGTCANCATVAAGHRCLPSQRCGCSTSADCNAGAACVNGACTKVCDAAHPCNGGCCGTVTDGGRECQAGNALAVCGSSGGLCAACPANQACRPGASGGSCGTFCSAAIPCAGGCCSVGADGGGTCNVGSAAGTCGKDGGLCKNCVDYGCNITGACLTTCTPLNRASNCNTGRLCCGYDAGPPVVNGQCRALATCP